MGPMRHDGEVVAWAAAHHGLITTPDLRQLGIERSGQGRLVRTGVLEPFAPSIWLLAGTPRTWQVQLRAAVAQVDPDGGAGFRAAATWWGLPGFTERAVEVVVRRDAPHPTRPIGTVHRMTRWCPTDLTVHDDLRVTDPLRTVTDVSPYLSAEHLDACVQALARRDLLTLDGLDDRLQRWRRSGCNGVTRTAEAIERNRPVPVSDSPLEASFLLLLRRRGIAMPQTQVEFHLDGRTFRVDTFWPDHRLVVELKGWGTHSTRAELAADAEREAAFVAAGYRLVSFTHDQIVRDPDHVVRRLRSLLRPQPHPRS